VSSEKPKAKADAGTGGGAPSPKREAPVTMNNSGRVKFDDRGNAVWEWSVSTGMFGTDVTSRRLKKLENHTLALADDPVPPPSAAAAAAAAASPTIAKENRKGVTQGYSPYDSGLLVKADAEVKRTKKKDLRRLSEWLKLREQVNRNKLNDD
jgi:hypothetical protein